MCFMPIAMPPRWYVIQCKPREEARALENLERQLFSCYCPTASVEKRRHGRKVRLSEPFFPGYLFIRLDERDNWSLIRSTRGVVRLVGFDHHPVPIADEIIETIRQRVAMDAAPAPYLKPGERVRVTEGAFAQLEAIFVANDGDERVLLLMGMLQREHRLSFPITSVQRVRASY
jgi:transcriptional antiterminator RfaH